MKVFFYFYTENINPTDLFSAPADRTAARIES